MTIRTDLASLTVRAFWSRRIERGFMAGAAPGTMKSYKESLAKWEATTDDPPVAQVVKETIDAFRQQLLVKQIARAQVDHQPWLFADLRPAVADPRSLSPATVNKHMRQIHHVLVEAVDVEILDRIPRFTYCKLRKKRPRAVKPEHLEAIYGACWKALYPILPGLLPERWWQAFLTTACTIGFRRQGLLGLRWADVDLRDGLIRLRAEDDKCDQERCKPLSHLLVQHLVRIRTDRELVFAWPHSQSTFYRQWKAIQSAAGLTRPDWYKIHDLKRTCGTMHSRQGASPWAIKELLDHSTLRTSEYYIDASDEAREAVERLRLPPAFYADFPAPSAAG